MVQASKFLVNEKSLEMPYSPIAQPECEGFMNLVFKEFYLSRLNSAPLCKRHNYYFSNLFEFQSHNPFRLDFKFVKVVTFSLSLSVINVLKQLTQ